MKIEGETGVMLPQAKECQEPPGVGKDQEGFSLRDQWEHGLLLGFCL